MDKETALHVLGLSATASLEQAKSAYRQLAKKHHPDVLETKSNTSSPSESRMKDINLAFRFLVPYLKSESTIPKRGKNKSFREKKPVNATESTHSKQTAQNNIFSVLKSYFSRMASDFWEKQKTGNTTHFHPKRKRPAPGFKKESKTAGIKKCNPVKTDNVNFDDILTTFSVDGVKENPITKGKTKLRKAKSSRHQGRQVRSRYSRYKQYMQQKKKYQPISSQRSKSMRVERVTRIDPISPVEPVAKD